MNAAYTVVLGILLVGAEPPPESLKPVIEKLQRVSNDELERLAAQRLAWQRGKGVAAVGRKAFKELDAEVKAIKAGAIPKSAVLNPDYFRKGQVGRLLHSDYGTALCTTVLTVIDETQILTSGVAGSEPFILTGISTEDLVDDCDLCLSGIYEVLGTTAYVSVLGSKRTVFVLRHHNTDTVTAWLKRGRRE